MSHSSPGLSRPRRWDVPFSRDMTATEVGRLLRIAPFKDMDPDNFPKSAQLQDILKNDARLRQFKPGEIIVREGDYGTSAFMVLSGTAEVVLSPGLPPRLVGRSETRRRGLFRALAQLWSNSDEEEVVRVGQSNGLVAAGDSVSEPGVILQDIPRVLTDSGPPRSRWGTSSGRLLPFHGCRGRPPSWPTPGDPRCWRSAGRVCAT